MRKLTSELHELEVYVRTLGHKDVYYVDGTVRGTAVGEKERANT